MKTTEYKNYDYEFALRCLSAAIDTVRVKHPSAAQALLTAAEIAFTRPSRLAVGDLVEFEENVDWAIRGVGIVVGHDPIAKECQVFWFRQFTSSRPGWLPFRCAQAELRPAKMSKKQKSYVLSRLRSAVARSHTRPREKTPGLSQSLQGLALN